MLLCCWPCYARLYPGPIGAASMPASMSAANSDLRVVVAGAGGRMGRTLIHAVAATKGVTHAGSVDAPDSGVIGRYAGELAGLCRNVITISGDVAPLLQ